MFLRWKIGWIYCFLKFIYPCQKWRWRECGGLYCGHFLFPHSLTQGALLAATKASWAHIIKTFTGLLSLIPHHRPLVPLSPARAFKSLGKKRILSSGSLQKRQTKSHLPCLWRSFIHNWLFRPPVLVKHRILYALMCLHAPPQAPFSTLLTLCQVVIDEEYICHWSRLLH